MRAAVDRLLAGIAERVHTIQRRQQHELRHVQQAIVKQSDLLARGHGTHGLAGMIDAIALRAVEEPELLKRSVRILYPTCIHRHAAAAAVDGD